MNLTAELVTERGCVTGFGRVKIPRMPIFDYEIPLLSFVTVKMKNGSGFVAVCIHLQIDGYGNTENEAVKDMVNNIWRFLRESFKNGKHINSAWDNILDLFKSNPRSNVLWDKYHALQVYFAKKGVSTDHDAKLNRKIKLLQNRVHVLEKRINELKGDTIEDRNSYIWKKIEDKVVVQHEDAYKKVA